MVQGQTLPAPAPMPEVRATQPENSITMQDPATFAEVKMDFPIAAGPFEPTWESIAKNYPGTPAWLREAKFGIWVHFGPQAEGRSGDWYARKIYQPGTTAYANHVRDFGPPSQTGYMDVLHAWNPTKLDPAGLVKLYDEAGAKFLIVQGVHHDNFDNWNSKYQPWNSVNVGPHRDLLGEWSKAAHGAHMRFGVAFHHEYTWWWYQPAFGSDTTGPDAGKPYDAARLTLADGKGKWWEGLDPRLLYGIDLRAYKDVANVQYRPEKGIFQDHLDYAHWYTTRWSLRIMDVIHKYDPDFIYTDGDSSGPFSGDKTGTGYKCDCVQRVIADFYNHTLATRGKVDTFSIIKFHHAANGIVSTVESKYPKDIKTDQDWIGENAAGDWFYKPDIVYSSRALELYLLEEVSRDGSYAVNIPISPEGAIDPGAATMLREMGVWMRINGEAIYGSHAWKRFGEGPLDANGKQRLLPTGALNKPQAEYHFTTSDFRFTVGKDGSLYAFVLEKPKPGEILKITSLASPDKPITSVKLLGSSATVAFKLAADGLEIIMPQHLPEQDVLGFRIQ
ncbi:alpha-L-fucosidase [Bryocella elongata]|nr:alpha-L-fucosidase [Bryocella elongata]